MSNEKKNQSSSDDHIMALDPMDHVRLRPEIYVGGRDSKALNNLFNELVDYVIHHARANLECSVVISLLGPQTLSLRDNSSIVPLHTVSQNWTFLELMMSFIGVGSMGEFVIEGEKSSFPQLITINPLSRDVKVEIRRDGALWKQNYHKGHKTGNLTYIRDLTPDEEHGTAFTFIIDHDIFGNAAFDVDWIEQRLFDVTHLVPGLNISFENAMTGHQSTHYYPEGMAHYIVHLNRLETPLYPPLVLHSKLRSLTFNDRTTRFFEIDLAMQFLTAPHGEIYSFVRALEIERRGPHTEAFFEALRDSLLGHSHLIKREDFPDLFSHVRLVINLWHRSAMFESQTNRVLLNRDIRQPIYEELTLALLLYFKQHPDCIPQLEALVMENRKKKYGRRAMRLV